ncbi:MAG: hypothetical protein R3Y26_07255 [Rikenellaceae bacterium]
MKDFDINKIGKKMPYAAPSDDFFEKFSADMLSKVEEQEKKRINLRFRKIISFTSAIAAMFIAGLMLTLTMKDETSSFTNSDYLAYENVNASIDSYLCSLSDSEISNLFSEIAYEDDFYSNLPTD